MEKGPIGTPLSSESVVQIDLSTQGGLKCVL